MNGDRVAAHVASEFRRFRAQADRAVAAYESVAQDPTATPRRISLAARKAAAALNRLASTGVLPVRFR